MQFVGREREIARLREIREQSRRSACFTVVTGRRRIGKTALLVHAHADAPMLYFFVSRQPERELCEAFRAEIEEKLDVPVGGAFDRFEDVFDFVMRLARDRQVSLVIDEFQEFLRVNPAVYGQMQRIWDLRHEEARIDLTVCGSVHSLMDRLFRDRKEPLFGRQTSFIELRPFSTATVKSALLAANPAAGADDLLALWALTGGVAKYMSVLLDEGAVTRDAMLSAALRPDSIFLSDGKAQLVEAFGKDYGVYFAILAAIARGRTDRGRIEQSAGREVGGYLTRLENEHRLVSVRRPMFATSGNKGVRYALDDEFLRFWFRFVHTHAYMLEIGAFDALSTVVRRDWGIFTGLALERWFRSKLAESGQWTRVGAWWDRKGENEIDIVAENELENRAVFFEVKRDIRRFDEMALRRKADAFLAATGAFKGHALEYRTLSLADM